MVFWTWIKSILGLGVETTGGILPAVTSKLPMPPVKPPREPDEEIEVTIVVGKKKASRKLSTEMPKATNPRIKRKLTVDGGARTSATALLAAAHEDIVKKIDN